MRNGRGSPRAGWVRMLLGTAVLAGHPATAQTPPAPATVPVPVPVPAKPAEQELIYQGEATSILGRQVRDPANEPVGRIVDVLVDDAGQPRAAVIDFGGFMGVGNRRVAVAWRALRFVPAQGRGTIGLDMTADQIKDTPEFRRPAGPAAPPVSVAAPPAQTPPVQTSPTIAPPEAPAAR